MCQIDHDHIHILPNHMIGYSIVVFIESARGNITVGYYNIIVTHNLGRPINRHPTHYELVVNFHDQLGGIYHLHQF